MMKEGKERVESCLRYAESEKGRKLGDVSWYFRKVYLRVGDCGRREMLQQLKARGALADNLSLILALTWWLTTMWVIPVPEDQCLFWAPWEPRECALEWQKKVFGRCSTLIFCCCNKIGWKSSLRIQRFVYLAHHSGSYITIVGEPVQQQLKAASYVTSAVRSRGL